MIHNKLLLICAVQYKMSLTERNADLTNGDVRLVSGQIFAKSQPISFSAFSRLFSIFSSICAVRLCIDISIQFKMPLVERNADLTNGDVRPVSGQIFAQS